MGKETLKMNKYYSKNNKKINKKYRLKNKQYKNSFIINLIIILEDNWILFYHQDKVIKVHK